MPQTPNITIIGLGYVGLPLAAAFGTRFNTVGFDIDATRIAQLRDGIDRTRELEPDDFARAERLRFTDDLNDIAESDVYTVTVPALIGEHKRPPLFP